MLGLLPFVLAASASAVALRPLPNETRRARGNPRKLTWRPSYDLPKKFAQMWDDEDAFDASRQKAVITGVAKFAPHGPGIKLVVGIPIVLSQQGVHEAHLQTWVKGKGVCRLQYYHLSTCSIFPVFLLGNSTAAQARARNASTFAMSLPVPEPEMSEDDGYFHPEDTKKRINQKDADVVQFVKPYFWFKYASDNYQWATHLGKMDADTYPHFKHVLSDLAKGPSDNLYWGAHMGGAKSGCKKGYMQGGMFIISAKLQPCMQPVVARYCPERSMNFARWQICPHHPLEDQYFGACLFYAAKTRKCPPVTCMDVHAKNRYLHPCCGKLKR